MNPEEIFVGAVAIALGSVGVIAAVGNWEVCYRLDKIRWLESLCGRWCSRALYAVIGSILIALGLAIACGYGPNKSSSPSRDGIGFRIGAGRAPVPAR